MNTDDQDTLTDVVKALKNKRACIRRNITTFTKSLDEFGSDNTIKDHVVKRRQTCENSLNDFEKYLNDKFSVDDENVFGEFFDDLYEMERQFACLNSKFDNSKTDNKRDQLIGINVNLPVISLPSFDGQYSNYFSFIDTFDTLIHKRKDISDLQKLQYLQSALKSDAKEVIKCLELSDANYEQAWQLLKIVLNICV